MHAGGGIGFGGVIFVRQEVGHYFMVRLGVTVEMQYILLFVVREYVCLRNVKLVMQ